MPESEIKNSKIFLSGLTIVVCVAIGVAIFLGLKLLDRNNPALEVAGQEEASSDHFFSRLEQHQEKLLKSNETFPRVAKDGRTLTVTFENGKKKSFENCLDCGPEKDVEHFLVERITDPPAILIYRQFYEGDDQVLVMADGQTHDVPSYPVFSPDRKSFIVVSAAEAFNWNGIEVWTKDGSAYVRQLRFEPRQTDLYRFLSWESNDLVKVEYSTYEAGPDSKAICQGAEVYREGKEWKLRDIKERVANDFCPTSEDWIPETLRRFGGPVPNED